MPKCNCFLFEANPYIVITKNCPLHGIPNDDKECDEKYDIDKKRTNET